jgi:hypothetical protein
MKYLNIYILYFLIIVFYLKYFITKMNLESIFDGMGDGVIFEWGLLAEKRGDAVRS